MEAVASKEKGALLTLDRGTPDAVGAAGRVGLALGDEFRTQNEEEFMS